VRESARPRERARARARERERERERDLFVEDDNGLVLVENGDGDVL